MSVEDRVKMQIGDLVVQLAAMQARVEQQAKEIAELKKQNDPPSSD